VAVAHEPRLLLREDHDLPRLVGEALEHRARSMSVGLAKGLERECTTRP
jgi:hypothetical protein